METISWLRSKKERGNVTVEKLRRDGTLMYMEARYVIMLDEHGNIVERIDRSKTWKANYLVVLVPIIYKGERISRAIALEIGIGRLTPYAQYEWKEYNGTVHAPKGRKPVVRLTEKKLLELLPTLASSLQSIVDEDVKHRKTLTYESWRSRGQSVTLYNGKFVTIPLEETVLVYIILERDFIKRCNGHLAEFVGICKEGFRKLEYAVYKRGELKRKEVAQLCAQVLIEANYPPHFVEAIRKMFGKETTKNRALFEQIIEEFKITFPEPDGHHAVLLSLRPLYHKRRGDLLKLFPVTARTDVKRNRRNAKNRKTDNYHARSCLRVEIEVSQEAVARKHARDAT